MACLIYMNLLQTNAVFSFFFYLSILFIIFFLLQEMSNHYEYAFWMMRKLNIKFRSVHTIRRTYSLNVLQIMTLNIKQFKSFDIAYQTRMIYKPLHIKTCFG